MAVNTIKNQKNTAYVKICKEVYVDKYVFLYYNTPVINL